MQKFEERKLARKQSRVENRALAQATKDGFAQYFQDRKEAQSQRRVDKNWSYGLPGGQQAQLEHQRRMQGFEDRSQTRKQSRFEQRVLAHATKDRFALYFQARKEAQALRRKNMNWAHGLPGAHQAQREHDQRMQQVEERKQLHKQSRMENRALAQATKDGFAEYFQVRKEAQALRRKGMNWAAGLPGAQQAQREHEQRMQKITGGKHSRKQSRLENRALAQTTKESFAQYFQARKEAQAQRREEKNWSQGLTGGHQAQLDHQKRMHEFQDRRQTHKKRRSEQSVANHRKSQNWAQGLVGAEQAQFEHKQQMRNFDVRKRLRDHSRSERRTIPGTSKASYEQQTANDWAEGLPGAKQAQIEHARRMYDLAERNMARARHRDM